MGPAALYVVVCLCGRLVLCQTGPAVPQDEGQREDSKEAVERGTPRSVRPARCCATVGPGPYVPHEQLQVPAGDGLRESGHGRRARRVRGGGEMRRDNVPRRSLHPLQTPPDALPAVHTSN